MTIDYDRTMEVTVRVPVMMDDYNDDEMATAKAVYSMLSGSRSNHFFGRSDTAIMSAEEIPNDEAGPLYDGGR